MRGPRLTWVLLGIRLMGWPMWGEAQGVAAVFDAQNFLRNTATAIATAEQLKNQLKDLQALADFVEYEATISDVMVFAQTASQIGGRLLGRYNRWTALIPTAANIPCTIAGLARWSEVYDRDTQESLFDAGAAQTLLAQSAQLLSSVSGVLQVARGITGSTSGLQSLHALLAKLIGLTGQMTTARAPMDESQARASMRQRIHAQTAKILAENRLVGLTGGTTRTCQPIEGF